MLPLALHNKKQLQQLLISTKLWKLCALFVHPWEDEYVQTKESYEKIVAAITLSKYEHALNFL